MAPAVADESDQYLSWKTELDDSAPALNRFIEGQAQDVIDKVNADGAEECTCEDLAELIFRNVYLDRFRAPVLEYVETEPDVDVYPPRDVSHREMYKLSIYRDVAFPSMIQMTRTLRIGEVYLGADKLAHFFGIGRRYYVRYQLYRSDGQTKDEAIKEAVRWGVMTENSFLGKMINGIFSHADLESNYQGLLMAVAMCEGNDPYLERTEDGWQLARRIDIEHMVTPLFDESYNPPHYSDEVLKAVIPILEEEYRSDELQERVAKRFERYGVRKPSFTSTIVERVFEHNGVESQHELLRRATSTAH